jgi:hypothetical protein
MGSVGDWAKVLFMTLFWGAWMLFVIARKRKHSQLQPTLFPSLVLMWVFAALFFGMVTGLHFRRAFSWPLVTVTIGFFIAVVVMNLYIRTKHSDLLRKNTSG